MLGKNTYLTGYFPLFAIILYSASFGFLTEEYLVSQLQRLGIYQGMTELFSISTVQVSLWFIMCLFFFMLFAALKLISDTLIELSLFFFSKESEGHTLNQVRSGSSIFLVGGLCSILFIKSGILLLVSFTLACFIYFCFFIYKASEKLSIAGMFGVVFMNLLFWVFFTSGVVYAFLKVYGALMSGILSGT
ncbi:DUF5366 family protein [Alkalihalobacillus sp. AL-G]|uniref:DUF5366 family protein n=1 Tax=Alkalihalobacillus sp. AL-G TaxID=2926399 RepID=UPI00272CC69B|nr:DUF5366 family protein [Alkalihalobacillus sp. AL-G]WLD94010.1 YufK family protein [Alkalihalobacillus sp. AL-G]